MHRFGQRSRKDIISKGPSTEPQRQYLGTNTERMYGKMLSYALLSVNECLLRNDRQRRLRSAVEKGVQHVPFRRDADRSTVSVHNPNEVKLFRNKPLHHLFHRRVRAGGQRLGFHAAEGRQLRLLTGQIRHEYVRRRPLLLAGSDRSEEHTSELQSRGHLVCRLLLE